MSSKNHCHSVARQYRNMLSIILEVMQKGRSCLAMFRWHMWRLMMKHRTSPLFRSRLPLPLDALRLVRGVQDTGLSNFPNSSDRGSHNPCFVNQNHLPKKKDIRLLLRSVPRHLFLLPVRRTLQTKMVFLEPLKTAIFYSSSNISSCIQGIIHLKKLR